MAKEKITQKQPRAGKNSAVAPWKSAAEFKRLLQNYQSDHEREKIQRYFRTAEGQYSEGDQFMGVRMRDLFALAKAFKGMPVAELEKLLESPVHELRAGAISIMDKESRTPQITPLRLKSLYTLYMRRHDRVNNWDLVDLGCLYMTGRYLFDKPRRILYRLARSKNRWERRTAILSTCYFIRQKDLDDCFALAEFLRNDPEDLVQKAVGWMLRFAGDKDKKRLIGFLDRYAATLPRTLLRNAIEKLDAKQKAHYLAIKKNIK